MNPERNSIEPSSFEEAVRAATDQVRDNQASQEVETEARPPILTRPPVIAGVATAFLGIVIWNFTVFFEAPAVPTPREEAQLLPMGLFAATQAVEAFRTEKGRLPTSAGEAGLPGQSFEFRTAGDEYVVTAIGSEKSVEHRSIEGMSPLLERMGVAYTGGAR